MAVLEWLVGWRQQQSFLVLRPRPQQLEQWAGRAVLHPASDPSLPLWILWWASTDPLMQTWGTPGGSQPEKGAWGYTKNSQLVQWEMTQLILGMRQMVHCQNWPAVIYYLPPQIPSRRGIPQHLWWAAAWWRKSDCRCELICTFPRLDTCWVETSY